MSISGLWRLSLAVLLMGGPAASALAQESEPIEGRVEQLYASPHYEQVLALLDGSNDRTAHLYRALCLLALSRQLDSQRAVESLVTAAPEFTISAEEVPPRFLMLLTETRRALLPGLLRKLFAQAREQYQAKAYDRAVPIFERILNLSETEDLRSLEDIGDLRVLSEGFVDLAKTPQAPPPPQTVAAAADDLVRLSNHQRAAHHVGRIVRHRRHFRFAQGLDEALADRPLVLEPGTERAIEGAEILR